jgi:hypothetical protein
MVTASPPEPGGIASNGKRSGQIIAARLMLLQNSIATH